jgi:hypothetical protein
MSHLLLALLTLALGTVPTPPPADVTRLLNYATLTPAAAARLHGRRVRVVVDLDGDSADLVGGWTAYDAGSGRADDMRAVWAAGELEDQGGP